jgi:TfoX/Sxy family transcriptional regulator of competence genes
MAYDEVLAERIRASLDAALDAAAGEIVEKRMFGGIAFMVNTHMACGILGDDLMVRVGTDLHEQAIADGAREMDFTHRPMRGMVMVDGDLLDDDVLDRWVATAVDVAMAQPPKEPKAPKQPRAKAPKK